MGIERLQAVGEMDTFSDPAACDGDAGATHDVGDGFPLPSGGGDATPEGVDEALLPSGGGVARSDPAAVEEILRWWARADTEALGEQMLADD